MHWNLMIQQQESNESKKGDRWSINRRSGLLEAQCSEFKMVYPGSLFLFDLQRSKAATSCDFSLNAHICCPVTQLPLFCFLDIACQVTTFFQFFSPPPSPAPCHFQVGMRSLVMSLRTSKEDQPKQTKLTPPIPY